MRIDDDVPTLAAVGAAVALAASLAHEALGHGVGCRLDHGTITLITFLVFRYDGGGALADGGGPIGALVVALAGLIVAWRRPRVSIVKLFAYAFGVQVMLWVFAQLVSEGIDGSDDWGYLARDLGWPPAWHAMAIAVGAIGYVATIRIATALGRPIAAGRPARLLIPWASSCIAAVLLAGLWHGGAAASAFDAFLSFGVAPLGYLFAIRAIAREPVVSDVVRRNIPWLASVVIAVAALALTIARGVGKLA